MKIAIISDIHDNENQLLSALIAIADSEAQCLICLGNLESTQTLRSLRGNWDKPLHLVLGNNDWPEQQYQRLCEQWDQTQFHGVEGKITIAGRQLYFTHFPHAALLAAQGGLYDAAFYGHTHHAQEEYIGRCLLLNPGELQGRSKRYTWALYDSDTNSATIHSLS